MKWPAPLVEATLIRRYKRFLADFTLPGGDTVTAHCANTGSMKTCMAEGAPSWLTFHDNPKRKLKYTWQAVRMPDGWVGINTGIANALVMEAVTSGVIAELQGYSSMAAEQKYGERSRIDILLHNDTGPACYVEVKKRGAKHLHELAGMLAGGSRAVLLYCVQRESAREVAPARAFDPYYAESLKQVVSQGLEVYAYRAELTPRGATLVQPLLIRL